MSKIRFAKSGWRVTFDASEVFPANPGNGTPALVVAPDGRTGTLHCVTDTGECDGRPVPSHIAQWLEGLVPLADQFIDEHS